MILTVNNHSKITQTQLCSFFEVHEREVLSSVNNSNFNIFITVTKTFAAMRIKSGGLNTESNFCILLFMSDQRVRHYLSCDTYFYSSSRISETNGRSAMKVTACFRTNIGINI